MNNNKVHSEVCRNVQLIIQSIIATNATLQEQDLSARLRQVLVNAKMHDSEQLADESYRYIENNITS